MMPEPVTPPETDTGRRAQSVYDLEETLVKFITRLFVESYRLDNPTLNLAQVTAPSPPIVTDPDQVVPYDPTGRSQTLHLKVSPRVVRGRVPRTVTGEIALDKLPDCPAIIIQVVAAKVQNNETIATVRILVSAYDENPDGGGYQDVQNMIEAIALALTSFGQAGIDQSYPIIMPFEWKLVEADCFPHYVGEMTTEWELPSARPLPDSETFGIVPAEHIEFRGHYPGSVNHPLPPPYEPPPVPMIVLADSWPVSELNDPFSYGFYGTYSRIGEAFVASLSGKLHSAVFWLQPRAAGNPVPAFQIQAELYAAVGQIPTAVGSGAPLAVSQTIMSSDEVPAVGGLFEFLFDKSFELVAGQMYVVLVRNLAGSVTGNGIYCGCKFNFSPEDGAAYTNGNFCNASGQTWSADDYADMIFYVYVET